MTLSCKLAVPQVRVCMDPQPQTKRIRKDVSYQILHAKYLLERLIQKFIARSANFDVVFFQGSFHPPEV